MGQIICGGCQGVIDYTGIPAFTVCECSDCGKELTIPKEFGHLLLERRLESNSYFDVCVGFNEEKMVQSVIYFLKKDIEQYELIQKEAKEMCLALSTLNHANISPLIDFGDIEGKFYFSEPLMDGFDLSEYNPAEQKLARGKVVDVMQAVALGLAIAHHKEFPHHNICPENIHIDKRGNVRIKNFMLSQLTYKIESLLELPSSISPYFISPEKAESGIEDKRGDIFAFGVLFYYLLSGSFPFKGKTEMETIYSRIVKKEKKTEVFNEAKTMHLSKKTVEYMPPVHISKLCDELDPAINGLVMRMLDYLPKKRPNLPHILDALVLIQAKEEQAQGILKAQHSMVDTKTKALPIMSVKQGKKDIHKKKRRFFFK